MNTVAVRPSVNSGRTFPGVDEFESGTVNPESFDHEAHVYIAWKLLEEDALSAATLRFTAALRKLTEKHGIQGKYHETIVRRNGINP
jgi:hypothetical protein